MKYFSQKLPALFLTLILCLSLLNSAAAVRSYADLAFGYSEDEVNGDEDDIIDTGSCGTGLTWTLYDSGELLISGEGSMTEFSGGAPWGILTGKIKKITIGAGVGSLTAGAFGGCAVLAEVEFLSETAAPAGVKAAFNGSSIASAKVTVICTAGVSFAEAFSADITITLKHTAMGADDKCTACGKTDPESITLVKPVLTAKANDDSGNPVFSRNTLERAVKYELCRAETENGTYTKYADFTGEEYTVTGATAGKTYWYKLKATDANGNESLLSDGVSGKKPVGTVTASAANGESSGLPVLSWTQVTGADTYAIYRAAAGDTEYTKAGTTGNLYFSDNGASAGVKYSYKVAAVDAEGDEGPAGEAVEILCILKTPSVSAGAHAVTGRPSLTWQAVSGATGYEIYRSTAEDGAFTKIADINETIFADNDSALVKGETWFYKVRAVLSGTAGADSAPSVPLGVTVINSIENGYELKIDLSAVPGAEEIFVDGIAKDIERSGNTGTAYLDATDSRIVTAYTYNTTTGDVHTIYPTGVYVWKLSYDSAMREYTAERLSDFDNILGYAGSSIRITGNKGIRMITSVPNSLKSVLTGSGLNGYTLEEYGTVVAWDSELNGASLTLDSSCAKSNYAYKKGVADPIYKLTDSVTQYTNVLVGFSDEKCVPDLSMRAYIKLSAADGVITIYGGTVHRSIGYIAYQNRNAFKPGTDSYNYIWGIIHYVYGDTYDSQYQG